MRAFEPEELEKVSIAEVRQANVPVHERRQDPPRRWDKRFASLATSVGLICFIALVLALIAGGATLNLLRGSIEAYLSPNQPGQDQKRN